MNRSLAAFYLVLISCALGLSIFVSRSVGNLLVLGGYAVFVVTAMTTTSDRPWLRGRDRRTLPIRYRPSLLVLAAILWVVFFVGFVRDPSVRALLRAGAFIVLSAITLFVVPAVVSRRQAFRAIGILGAASVVIALPSLIWPDYTLAGIRIAHTLANGRTELTLGFISHTPISFFEGISYFRVLATIGAICAGGLFVEMRDRWMGLACVLCVFGVFLGTGRATILGLAAAFALAAVYRVAGLRVVAAVTAFGILAVAIALAIAAGIVPGPMATVRAALGKRVGYWAAAVMAVFERPVLGWGLTDTTAVIGQFYSGGRPTGVHSSYLRVFVIGGVVGGISYLALCGSALVAAFRSLAAHTPLSLTAYCLLVATLVIQLFTGGTIFGTNLSSVLWALTIGYAHPAVTE